VSRGRGAPPGSNPEPFGWHLARLKARISTGPWRAVRGLLGYESVSQAVIPRGLDESLGPAGQVPSRGMPDTRRQRRGHDTLDRCRGHPLAAGRTGRRPGSVHGLVAGSGCQAFRVEGRSGLGKTRLGDECLADVEALATAAEESGPLVPLVDDAFLRARSSRSGFQIRSLIVPAYKTRLRR
jgi:hypothetical protein